MNDAVAGRTLYIIVLFGDVKMMNVISYSLWCPKQTKGERCRLLFYNVVRDWGRDTAWGETQYKIHGRYQGWRGNKETGFGKTDIAGPSTARSREIRRIVSDAVLHEHVIGKRGRQSQLRRQCTDRWRGLSRRMVHVCWAVRVCVIVKLFG